MARRDAQLSAGVARFAVLAACALTLRADSKNQVFSDFVTPLPVKPGETLAIGVVGGWERWDNPARCIRRTAVVLKRKEIAGLHVETVENHKLDLAEELVRKAFDFNRDGMLSREEAARARMVVFGQSLGGRGAVWLCRKLNEMGIAVRLLIVVDAYGKDSYLVPPNVARAANWYQREHLFIKGAPEIRAEDASRTRILGNTKVSYKGRTIDVSDAEPSQVFWMDEHLKMEFDRTVWDPIEKLLIEAVSSRD